MKNAKNNKIGIFNKRRVLKVVKALINRVDSNKIDINQRESV